MFKGFQVVKSLRKASAPEAFVRETEQRAALALRRHAKTAADAWALCEFIDLMDSGAGLVQPDQRTSAAAALSDFLFRRATNQELARFNASSFAAEAHGILPCPSLENGMSLSEYVVSS